MNDARVLIVEDERIAAFELRLGLAGLGYTVVGTVARGDEAVSRAGELRPDLVLMDVNIEGPLNGLQAAEEIVNRYRIPIVFLTAYANDEIIERALASRPLGYLVKPYDERELHAILQVALARHRFEAASARASVRAVKPEVTGDVEHGQLAREFDQALSNEEFELHYLPTVALADGAFIGVEALLRWRHPDRGLLQPAQFIPIAEASGAIDAIGRWVIRHASMQCARWSFEHGKPLQLAVNISARQLGSEPFARVVQDALRDANLSPAQLQLDFAEGALSHLDRADEALHALRDLGVASCIDDFGTGSLSLSRLQRMPITQIKIDRSVIERLPADAGGLAVVESMMAASHALGLRVTAEGVANEAQLLMLRQLGCHQAQGFLFSHPLSAASLGAVCGSNAPWLQATIWNSPTLEEQDEHRYAPPRLTLH